MAQLVSDIRILDNLLALNLNVSLWSARRKMSQEDLGGAELPPEDLASLGSKRIADPENLKVFGTLKARAFNYLDRHGVRFMASCHTTVITWDIIRCPPQIPNVMLRSKPLTSVDSLSNGIKLVSFNKFLLFFSQSLFTRDEYAARALSGK